jgi:hypothetical protein
MTNIHNFDAETGAFLSTIKARLDPLDRKPMVPANATLIAPPEAGANEVAVWAEGAWAIKPDQRGTEYWLADGSHYTITAIGEEPPEDALDAAPPIPRADQRKAALSRVDEEHANYLVTLTGGATVAERDTWKVKEEAARAFEADTATPGQTAMLTAEAQGVGITKAELAATIIAKADAFLALIGVAAGLRAKGRAAIMAATDDAVPLDQVEAEIEAVFAQLAEEVQAAIAQL